MAEDLQGHFLLYSTTKLTKPNNYIQGWGNSKRNWNYSVPINSIPELELKDFEQKKLELELNKKELILMFLFWQNPTFQLVHKQQMSYQPT